MKNLACFEEKIAKNILGYVPSMVLNYHMQEGKDRQGSDSEKANYPIEKELETVVMFADVSGFTMLSEKLASKGLEVGCLLNARGPSYSQLPSMVTWNCSAKRSVSPAVIYSNSRAMQ